MPTAKREVPSPEELLSEVRGKKAARTYEFEDYIEVVDELQRKDYSYAKIAEFLAERLGIEVSRGQVYRAYQIWLEEKEREAEAARDERLEQLEPSESKLDSDEMAIEQAIAGVLGYLTKEFPEGVYFGHDVILQAALLRVEVRRADERKADEEDQRKAAAKTNVSNADSSKS